MLHALPPAFASAVLERATLLANHVLAAEPVATDRLRPHAGRTLQLTLDGWPDLLPAPPVLRFSVTPAGLVEWLRADGLGDGQAPAPVDLELTLDARNPALALVQGLAGRRPSVAVTGDARFAADVSWVIDNVRWDLRDDLARTVGELPARELARTGAAAARGLRDALQGLLRRASPGAAAPASPSANAGEAAFNADAMPPAWPTAR